MIMFSNYLNDTDVPPTDTTYQLKGFDMRNFKDHKADPVFYAIFC